MELEWGFDLERSPRRDWQNVKLTGPAMPPTTFTPSPEQQKVIDHRGGHLQVVACAGAGKTEAISRRVASLIDGGVEPCQIVALGNLMAAFPRNRMRGRIASNIGACVL